MAPDNNVISEIEKLQLVVSEHVDREQQIAYCKKQLKKLQTVRATKERKLTQANEKLQNIQTEIRRLEEEIKTKSGKIKKYREEQMQVKTEKELSAVTHEIETVQQALDELENTELELLEQSEKLEDSISIFQQELDIDTEEFEEENERLKKQITTKTEQLKNSQLEIELAQNNVPDQSRGLVENLMQRFPHDFLTRVLDGCCAGCKMKLTRGILDRLKIQDQINRCEGCGRILH